MRDVASVKDAMIGVDYVFHAAAQAGALLRVLSDASREHNILGTENVLNAAIDAGVTKLIALSTDKASVRPINSMGVSKAMMERIIVAKGRNSTSTMIACIGTVT